MKNDTDLSLLEACIFLDQLLLTVARKAHRQLGGITSPFTAQDKAAAILGMTNVRARHEV
jgi:hypothetical protein